MKIRYQQFVKSNLMNMIYVECNFLEKSDQTLRNHSENMPGCFHQFVTLNFFSTIFFLFEQLNKKANCLNIGQKKAFFSLSLPVEKNHVLKSRLVEPSNEFITNRKQVCQVPRKRVLT